MSPLIFLTILSADGDELLFVALIIRRIVGFIHERNKVAHRIVNFLSSFVGTFPI